MRLSHIMWLMLVIAGGVSLFLLKYKVQALEDQLVAKNERIAGDRSAIRVLEAEWTYLNDPERLRRLSREYLGLVNPAPDRVAEISALPLRPAPDTPGAPDALPTPVPLPVLPAATTRADASSPHERSSESPVSFARLKRLLAPLFTGASSAFAQTPQERAR